MAKTTKAASGTAEDLDVSPNIDLHGEGPKALPGPGEPITFSENAKASLKALLSTIWEEAQAGYPEEERERTRDYWRELNARERPLPKYWPVHGPNDEPLTANYQIANMRAVVDSRNAALMKTYFGVRPFWSVSQGMTDDSEDTYDITGGRDARVEDFFDKWCQSYARFPSVVSKALTREAIESVSILYIPWRTDSMNRLTRPSYNDESGDFEADEKRHTGYKGPLPEVVPRDRFHLWPTDASTPEGAEVVCMSYVLTRAKLLQGLKATTDDNGKKRPPRFSPSKEELAKITGKQEIEAKAEESSDEDAPVVIDHGKRWNAVDFWIRYDPNEDGEEVECVVTYLPEQNALLGGRVHELGEVRPFVTLKTRDAGERLDGVATAALIEPLCRAIEDCWNKQLTHATLTFLLSMSPFVQENTGLEKFLLGQINVCHDPKGIVFPQFPPSPDYEAVAKWCWDEIEKITGISADQMGVPQPGNKTATEITTVTSYANQIFENMVKTLDVAMTKVAEIVSYWYYLWGDEEIAYIGEPTSAEKRSMMEIPRVPTELPPSATDAVMGLMGHGINVPPPPGSFPIPGGLPGEENALPPGPAAVPQPGTPQMPPMAPGGQPGAGGPQPGMGGMGGQQPGMGGAGGPQPGQPGQTPKVPTGIKRIIKAVDFAPGLEFSVQGSSANLNRDQQRQNELSFAQLMQNDPYLKPEGRWKIRRDVVKAFGKRADDYLVDEAEAAQMPTPGSQVQPNISITWKGEDLPPSAAAALLRELGLPGDETEILLTHVAKNKENPGNGAGSQGATPAGAGRGKPSMGGGGGPTEQGTPPSPPGGPAPGNGGGPPTGLPPEIAARLAALTGGQGG